MESALEHHRAGRLPKAETLYRQILGNDPGNIDAVHLLGVLALQSGHLGIAADLIGRAAAAAPEKGEVFRNLAVAMQGLGRFDESIAASRWALETDPRDAGSFFNLGLALRAKGRLDESIAAYRESIVLEPARAEFHNGLGNALLAAGQIDEAIATYREALRPDYADAYANLAAALQAADRREEAISACREALQINPNYEPALYNLGAALQETKRNEEAIAAYEQVLHLNPRHADAHNNLGRLYQAKGRSAEAIAGYQQAIQAKPGFFAAYNNLGSALADLGRRGEAVAACREAVRLEPEAIALKANLGAVLRLARRLDEAIEVLEQALRIVPDHAGMLNTLGNVFADRAQISEAIAAFRRALAIDPDDRQARSNLILALHYQPDVSEEDLQIEAREWDARHAAPLRPSIQRHENDRLPERRLRIGYLSPDFHRHVVGRNVLSFLGAHDPSAMETHAYADVLAPDALTDEIRGAISHWHDITGESDEAVAERIRADRIDILVDLALHTARNRLLVFARQPAPLQLSYLGYCGTTGLRTIQYRLSDPWIHPPEGDGLGGSEDVLRLPHCHLCYAPMGATPSPSPLPAQGNGFVTFGCLNYFGKVTAPALALWSELLGAVPDARLVLHAPEGRAWESVLATFQRAGIGAGRIEFTGFDPWEDYLAHYARIDIALDPFPFGGGITSCDALWMGVPLVTLAGRTSVGRVGCSILNSLGLPELVAKALREYLEIAANLANDAPRLAHLRATLRQRMEQSSLRDPAAFARGLETVYRRIWRNWWERNCG